MKKINLSLLLLIIVLTTSAQNQDERKSPSLGGSFFLKDFPTAAHFYGLNPTGWNNALAPGLSMEYIQGISNHFDFVLSGGLCDSRYKKSNGLFFYENGLFNGEKRGLMDATALLRYKFLTDNKKVVPYIPFGLGYSLYNLSYFLPNLSFGGGLQLKLPRGAFLYTQAILQSGVLRKGTLNPTKENLNYSIGFSLPLRKKKTVDSVKHSIPPPTPVVEVDTDHDSIPDSRDKCPTVPGLAKYYGCPIPDTDHDGINDEEDSCPTVPGLSRYHGCPIPDTDHDGINDEEDSCPSVPGLTRYHGCPIPDTDHDGVNDEEDKCPTEPGIAANKGCPEIQTKMNELSKKIFFTSGGAQIAPKAWPSLNEIVKLMNKYKGFKLEIEGHTDNLGGVLKNQKMSQKRADAIKNYFIKKGIDPSRLYAIGYGLEKPIASNKTAAGRALNRRVEMHAKY